MSMQSYVAQRQDYATINDYQKAKEDEKTIARLLEEYHLDREEDIKRLYITLQSGKILLLSDLGDQFIDDIKALYEGKTPRTNSLPKSNPKKQQISEKESVREASSNKKTEPKKVRFEDLDASMQKSVIKEMERSHKRRKTVIAILSLLALSSFGYFIYYYKHAEDTGNRMEELSNLVGSEALLFHDEETEEPLVIHYDDGDVVVPPVLVKYQTLYTKNKELIGWLQIADTIIDYPVLQTVDNEYYLSHNFDKKDDPVGCIFMDTNCDVIRGCDNFILYGHHLQSGKMFSAIEKYEKESFYKEHPIITFDTIYEEHAYQVMYVFRSRVFNAEDVNFKYYQFINANSSEEFHSAMESMAEMSFYDTGVNASYGDQLLTLSTCDYEQMNGRFVVVCKQIK